MRKWTIIILACAVAIAMSVDSAVAMSHDHDASHHSLSPFDSSKDHLSHHCVLSGHSTNNPCPHMLKNLKSAKTDAITISVDCGGASNQKSRASIEVNKQKVSADFREHTCLSGIYKLYSSVSSYSFFLQTPLYHPPRFI